MSAATPMWLPTPFGSRNNRAPRLSPSAAVVRLLFVCLLALLTLAPAPARAGLTGVPQEVAPGVFLWRSPLGHLYQRDRTGTTDLTPPTVDKPAGPPGHPPDR